PPPTGLIANPGFELEQLSPWTIKGSAQVQTHSSSTPAHSGTKSAYLSRSGAAFEQVISGLTPNTTYTLSAYLKRGSSRSNVALGVKDFGRSQVARSASSTSYRKITITFKTGSSNTTAKIFFYSNSGTGSADSFELSN